MQVNHETHHSSLGHASRAENEDGGGNKKDIYETCKSRYNFANPDASDTTVVGIFPAESKSDTNSSGSHSSSTMHETRFRCCFIRCCRSTRIPASATVPFDSYPVGQERDDIQNKIDVKVKEKICQRETIQRCLKSNTYHIVASVATIVSLLAFDFTIAFLHRSIDPYTLAVIGFVFVFFMAELLLGSASQIPSSLKIGALMLISYGKNPS